VLLAYSLGNEQSYLWLITQKEVKSFSLPKRSEIESLAKYLRELITARNLLAKGENIGGRPMTLELAASEYPKVATELSKILLSPLAKDLGNKRLVIIPDGVLQYIPFNALAEPSKTDTYQPLLVSHEVVSLPSVTTISVLRDENKENKENKEKAKKVLFIADPVFSIVDSRVKNKANQSSNLATNKLNKLNKLNELEEANLLVKQSAKEVGLSVTSQGLPRLSLVNDEIKQINELAPIESKQLLSFNASLSNLASETSSYKVIHFATYGLANGQHPDLSGIVLSLVDEQGKPQEGFLQPDKIFNLNLSTELLTLNCDTQIGKNMQGEGLSGLTRSFIYAGASRVMVNLWNTNDPASIELIKRFYEKILKENQSPTIALRQVQLEMLQDEKYKSPFYWAGFQLQGEWK